MKKFEGYIVDYMINAPCNLNCPFCFGPDPKLNKQELPLIHKLDLIKNLSNYGVKRIVIAGGEPTMDDDILAVCIECKKHNIGVSLQTNGFFLDKLINLLPFIDWIALPLDGISSNAQLKMRTSELHYKNFTKAIELVKDFNLKNKQIKIKVGTVLSKFNFPEIDTIAECLNNSGIDIWKIYEVRQRGKGLKAYNVIGIDNDKAKDKVLNIKSLYPNMNILYSSSLEKKDAYIIIDPDSDAYVIKGNDEKTYFGKLYDKGIFSSEKLQQIFSFSNSEYISSNVNKSFPGWI